MSHGFSVSLDGFCAGPEQSLANPSGKNEPELFKWSFPTQVSKPEPPKIPLPVQTINLQAANALDQVSEHFGHVPHAGGTSSRVTSGPLNLYLFPSNLLEPMRVT